MPFFTAVAIMDSQFLHVLRMLQWRDTPALFVRGLLGGFFFFFELHLLFSTGCPSTV